MATVKVTLSDLIDDGELDGYVPGRRYNALTAGVEEEVCAEAKCSFCGHEGLGCRSFLSTEHRSRRAFAECPACGNAEEI